MSDPKVADDCEQPLLDNLKKYFGYSEFKSPLQKKAILQIIKGGVKAIILFTTKKISYAIQIYIHRHQ
jgi:hypothetical protein